MRRNPLGRSGLCITPVGFGAWGISGGGWAFSWGEQHDDESVAAIRAAVDAGVNWIDTAPSYGMGRSERVVGRALAALPPADRPLVFTKCGLVWDEASARTPARRIMEPASVRREVDASLRRLGVDVIDVYQVHWPPTGRPLDYGGVAATDALEPAQVTPIEEYWQVLDDLRRAGKVRAIGLSNHDVEELQRAAAVARIDVVQPPLSLLARGAHRELAWCAANDVAAVVYSPMHSGLLTGAFSVERVAALPADDWRKSHPDFTTRLAPALELVEALRPIAERHGVSVAAVAVAWTLAWPGVTGAIVGARRRGQIAAWAPAAGLVLSDADLDDIAAALQRTGAGSGPARPPFPAGAG